MTRVVTLTPDRELRIEAVPSEGRRPAMIAVEMWTDREPRGWEKRSTLLLRAEHLGPLFTALTAVAVDASKPTRRKP